MKNDDDFDAAKTVLTVIGFFVWIVILFYIIGFFATIGPFAAF